MNSWYAASRKNFLILITLDLEVVREICSRVQSYYYLNIIHVQQQTIIIRKSNTMLKTLKIILECFILIDPLSAFAPIIAPRSKPIQNENIDYGNRLKTIEQSMALKDGQGELLCMFQIIF